MGAGTATVGRRAYAVGLYWENSPTGRVAQAAKEAARQPGQHVDFYALRAGTKDGRVPQFGLGQKLAGHKSGMPAFAACLANQQPGSWAGAFRLRDGTVLTVVRDDLILPDGDQFYISETEARERLLQEISFGGLQRIYAPEAWSIAGADSMPISLLLDDKHDITLRPVQISKQTLLLGGLAILLLLIVLGVGFYLQTSEKPSPVITSNLPTLEAPKPVYPPPDRKWEKQPLAMDVVANCQKGLAQIPAAVSGWHLSPFKCDGNSISLTWNRDRGITQIPKDAKVNEAGSTATQTISLLPMNPRGPQSLVDSIEITKQYLAQDWPGTLAHAQDDPPPPPPPGYKGEWNPPPAPWVKRSFTLTIPELPASLPLYLGSIPGVIINMMSYQGSGAWSVEGVIYENRS
jgi:hypothetical protein